MHTLDRLVRRESPPHRNGIDAAAAPVVLDIQDLTLGPALRAVALDPQHVAVLADVAVPLPPIVVQRTGLRVLDGVHRVRAAVLRGDTRITARLFDGTDDDAYLLALRCNITHGLPLTLTDRKAAAVCVLAAHPDWSDRAVAVAVGLSDKTVAAVRRGATAEIPQSTARIGADGRVRPLDGDHRRRLAADLLAAHPASPLREIAVAAGISVGTARDVRARVGRGEDPVPLRRRPESREPGDQGQARRGGRAVVEPRTRLAVVRRLRDDPSVRFSSAGRNVVRWLSTTVVGPARWQELLDAIPLHWVEVVADLARGCAQEWQDFAAACDERVRRAA